MKSKWHSLVTVGLVLLLASSVIGCATPAATPMPSGGNQPPVIASLTADPTQVTHNVISNLTCSASDTNGDTLTYTWSATGGTIRGSGSLVTWKAPEMDGEFIISVTVDDGKGGTDRASTTIMVQTNQRPTISSVIAEPTKVASSGTSAITCSANDADGDMLTYAWSATGGTITGLGNVVTWKAPDVDGEFIISVTVDDGKGGTVTAEYVITVETAEQTMILAPVTDESGSVSSSGDLYASTLVGDNANNKGIRAFFSFDISGLSGATIDEAKLTFTAKEMVGKPWNVSCFLLVEQVWYNHSLESADFYLEGQPLEKFTSSVPEEIDVTLNLRRLFRGQSIPHFQVRMHLSMLTNANNQDDYIDFSEAVLTITYTR